MKMIIEFFELFERDKFSSIEWFVLTYSMLLIASTSLAMIFRFTTNSTYHIPNIINENILRLETEIQDLPPFKVSATLDDTETVTTKETRE
ncbi:unnamed protein product [Caenorhabditis angaria]|uniref:Uncharacterized protein n=1 Tax=Caenorhabditis angaria TaxID=860376 RepID=A0A9P1MYN6_9PELO|nr:unnamed protein product [Caenorhabditis angaria]